MLLVFRGRNWARIVFVIVVFLSVPGNVIASASPVADSTARLVSSSQALLNVSAAVLLLLPASRRWYRGMKVSPNGGAA